MGCNFSGDTATVPDPQVVSNDGGEKHPWEECGQLHCSMPKRMDGKVSA